MCFLFDFFLLINLLFSSLTQEYFASCFLLDHLLKIIANYILVFFFNCSVFFIFEKLFLNFFLFKNYQVFHLNYRYFFNFFSIKLFFYIFTFLLNFFLFTLFF